LLTLTQRRAWAAVFADEFQAGPFGRLLHSRPQLTWQFRSLTLAQAHARTAAIFGDKLNTRLFKGASDFLYCTSAARDFPVN
jgi:hypothetical protein